MIEQELRRNPPLVSRPFQVWLVRTMIKLSFLLNTFRAYRSWGKSLKALRLIRTTLQKVWDQPELKKFVRLKRRYYWNYTGPHWPSAIQKKYLQDELNRVLPFQDKKPGLRILFYAITSRCPLQCDHCFEWDRLNQHEEIDVADMISQIKQFQARGVAQIHLTGGEPLARFDELITIITAISDHSDVWVLTSGYGITQKKVDRLKAAGLTGLTFSIDHYNAAVHDAFRGKEGVFNQALAGAAMAFDAGLVLCFALCARKEFISPANLEAYANLAAKAGASFINLIEPKAVGHYGKADVELEQSEQQVLEEFYFAMNYDEKYREYPILAYPNYQMRKIGCIGGGHRAVYINSSGEVNACPFCHENKTKLKDGNIDELLEALKTTTCQNFEPMKI